MTAMKTLGWGIVGLGRIAGNSIAPALSALENCELQAVASRDQGRAKEFAARFGARRALDSYEEMLADPLVEAVYICTPNALHATQVVEAAQAGKHVLCDKPLALSVPDAERAVSACEQARVRLGLMFQSRNYEGMAEVRDLVAAGDIGRVVIAEVEMSAGRTLLAGWRTDPALAGAGTTNNIGVHAYDLLGYLIGAEVTAVSAMFDVEPGFELDTTSLALLRFDNGTLGYVNVNQSVPNHRRDLVLYGTEGRVVGNNVTRMNLTGTLDVTGRGGQWQREVSTSSGYSDTIEEFTSAVLAGKDPSPSGADGVRSVAVVEAITRSVAERRTVTLGK